MRADAMTLLQVLGIVLAAVVCSRLLPRLVRRAVRRLDGRFRERLGVLRERAPHMLVDSGPVPTARYTQRAEALGTLYKQLLTLLIWVVAVIWILHVLGVTPAALVTGAGFLGVAVALGAQDLLRDCTAGFFFLVDDRFGVGDHVEAGGIEGDIEEMTLRWTRVRDTHGTEWYVPNRKLEEIGNRSQHHGKAVIDVDVPTGVRLADACDRISKSVRDLRDDPDVGPFVLEAPQILGVEAMTRDGVTIRLAVRTRPARQADVARVIRYRVRTALEGRDGRPVHDAGE
jgi:small conductance mechanosensitive channel